MNKLTPVLVVEDLERSIAFYNHLGFETRTLVPPVEPFYAALESGGVEIMLQTRPAMLEDVPAAAEAATGLSGELYIEVEDVDAMIALTRGVAAVLNEKREAPYGMTENIVRDPDGYVLVFAEKTRVVEAASAG